QIDRSNPNVVYTGYQFGNYYRLDLAEDLQEKIQPKHELGQTEYRFNWQTPILLSPHNQDIVYMGSNILHRSMNQGVKWESISQDLTSGAREGNVAYGTITSVSESPINFGLIYVGTDDGLVQRTDNSGTSWVKISGNLPSDLWISEVLASSHNSNRVFVCLNGYRKDDFKTYIFKSDDRGKSWKDISANIPDAPVNALAEDKNNKDLLFAATDTGLYVTFNGGQSWEVFQSGIPNVAIHDLVIQEEAGHLLAGTHGRSIYLADISILQQMNSGVLNSSLYVFDFPEIKFSEKWGNPPSAWSKPDTPGIDISFYSQDSGNFTAEVRTSEDIVVSSTELEVERGLNILSFDLAFSKKGKSNYLKKYKRELLEAKNGKTYLPQGSYKVEIKGNGHQEVKVFKIID
ncbi:MAG: glycosyl hydrolase, partial [Flavobacteriaceae bacterium]